MPRTLTIAMIRIAHLLLFDLCAVNTGLVSAFRGVPDRFRRTPVAAAPAPMPSCDPGHRPRIVSRMQDAVPRLIVGVLWLTWALYWTLAARGAKATRWRETPLSQALHHVPLLAAAALLSIAPSALPPALTQRILPSGGATAALGIALVAAGLGIAVWARRHLGRNWSSAVTVKEEHALIRTGPYRHVRHPIYSGILLAFIGTVTVIGERRGVIALALTLFALIHKSRVEERRMLETFPDYAGYRRTTAMLIPFVL
jgi:protein-S-isoprenylcysteine O-methyltransferase Ste14